MRNAYNTEMVGGEDGKRTIIMTILRNKTKKNNRKREECDDNIK